MTHRLSGRVEWGPGPVGDAVRASLDGRLRRFVRDEESEPVVLFSPEARAMSDAGDWYGEHLGKWLVAASHAARRTGDPELLAAVERVVAAVESWQEPDGYLGTYAPEARGRFTAPEAAGVRTWDLWVHAWAILGLLAISPSTSGSSWRGGRGERQALDAAARIGDLILAAFAERSPLDQGNHAGLSAGVIVHPLAELTLATSDARYAAFATAIVDELEHRTGLLSKEDVAEIGTGKAYQILWNLVGLVALHRATGEARLLKAAERLWTNVAEHHLTPLGGPWGGVAGHKEVFNAKGFFSPNGMVETCSAATWMALSRELFRLTGEARYVEAFERTLMNTLLGALDENGEDWVYFTFPNGRRNNTYHWACCKSSGALALEECSDMVASATDAAIWLHLLLPCRVEIEGATIRVEERDDEVTIRYQGDRPFRVRIPEWAVVEEATIDGAPLARGDVGGYLRVERQACGLGFSPLGEGREGVVPRVGNAEPHPCPSPEGGVLRLTLRRPIRVVPFTDSIDHHGQEIVRMDYACVARGPYVYATGPIDGYKREETLRLARLTPEASFRANGEGIDFQRPGRDPIPFLPYYRAGGRHAGAWRTTWLGIAWQ